TRPGSTSSSARSNRVSPSATRTSLPESRRSAPRCSITPDAFARRSRSAACASSCSRRSETKRSACSSTERARSRPRSATQDRLAADLVHAQPPPLLRRALDRFAHCLHARALREVWFPWPVGPALEQVGRLCDECHPVTDALTDRPPLGGVGMRRVLRTDATEAVHGLLVARVA